MPLIAKYQPICDVCGEESEQEAKLRLTSMGFNELLGLPDAWKAHHAEDAVNPVELTCSEDCEMARDTKRRLGDKPIEVEGDHFLIDAGAQPLVFSADGTSVDGSLTGIGDFDDYNSSPILVNGAPWPPDPLSQTNGIAP